MSDTRVLKVDNRGRIYVGTTYRGNEYYVSQEPCLSSPTGYKVVLTPVEAYDGGDGEG